jgi:hypothetical protein
MTTNQTLQAQIDALNATVAELRAQVPAPKPIPVPKKPQYGQIRKNLWVRNHKVPGYRPMLSTDIFPAWNIKMALEEAKRRQKIHGFSIQFVDWMTDPNAPGVVEGNKILIVEELEVLQSGNCGFEKIRTWESEASFPKALVEQGSPVK